MPTETASDRNIPHNLEAERALLGSILLDNEALALALESLTREDFYSEAHRITFAKMERLARDKRPIDLVTLTEELGKDNQIERAGGAAYLSALTDGVPIGASSMAEYCRIVREKAIRRRIINSANPDTPNRTRQTAAPC